MSRGRLRKRYDLKVLLKRKECRGRRAESLLPRGEKDRMSMLWRGADDRERSASLLAKATRRARSTISTWRSATEPRRGRDLDPGGAGGARGVRVAKSFYHHTILPPLIPNRNKPRCCRRSWKFECLILRWRVSRQRKKADPPPLSFRSSGLVRAGEERQS
jgi:hypothetical protein